MVQEPELEEGETCYYSDDANIDPDVALSYIGEKVQSILGHLQKDFEGGVSAENLGSKFGGYGSFLPTYQRSPSIWSQQKSPPRVQNSHLPRSPNACAEGPTPKSVTPSTRRDDVSSPSVRSSRQKATLPSSKVSETFPGKVELPSSKLANPLDQRTLKVRIKVGPERVARYNAQIHSLGLTSPSSSEGNSQDESDELLFETRERLAESPAYILEAMTSLPMSDGLLLSPLCEDLLNLTTEREYKLESEYKATPKNSAISLKILNNDAPGGKKAKAFDNKLKDNGEDLDGCEKKTLHGDNMECSKQPFYDVRCKSLPDGVKNSDNNILINKRRVSKNKEKGRGVSGDSLKDVSFEHTSSQRDGKYEQLEPRCTSLEKIEEHRATIPHKDVSVDHGKSRGKGSYQSFETYSEGERVENAMDDSTLRTGLYESDPHPVGSLSVEGGKKSKVSQSSGNKALKSDSFRDGDRLIPQKKSIGRRKDAQLGLKDEVQTSVDRMENPKRLSGRASVDYVKAKPALADKSKERLSNKKHIDVAPSDSRMVEPSSAAVPSKEGTLGGFEQTVVNPVVIKEEWVLCDRCETWRLLPYGMDPEQLPEKWLCSMQDWLPEHNRCGITEDETTAALRALYKIPVPQNQPNFQAHTNGSVVSAATTIAHNLHQDHQNFAFDPVKKKKLQKGQTAVGTSYQLHSKNQMQMPLLDLERGGMKDVKPPLARGNFTDQKDMQHPSKLASGLTKLKKRKGEHLPEADSNLRKKIKQESGEYLEGKEQIKRIKSKDVPTFDNDLLDNEHNATLGLLTNATVKSGKKKNIKKEVISAGPGNIQINVRHEKAMHDLHHNGPLGVETCNTGQVTAKKIKLKDNVHCQERKVLVNDNSKDGDVHREKKASVCHNEDDGFRGSQGGDMLKRSVELGDKEYLTDMSIKNNGQQVKKPIAKMRLTIEDIDELRKDLGCEQLSMAATSSSSKISDSRKNRLSYAEVKGSPEESVSSSPMRMLYPNHVSPMMTETSGKVDFRFRCAGAVSSVKKQEMDRSSEFATVRRRKSGLTNDHGSKISDSKTKLNKETPIDDNHPAPKHEALSNMRHPLSNDLSLKSVKNSTVVGKNNVRKSKASRSEKQSIQREGDKNDLVLDNPCSSGAVQQSHKHDPPRRIEQSSCEKEPWSGKVRIDLRQGDKQGTVRPSKHASGPVGPLKGSPLDSRPHDNSVTSDSSKSRKGTTNENTVNKEAEQQSLHLDASLRNKNVSGAIASTALKEAGDILKEAEGLRSHADLIKNSGFTSESNYEYFKAALKFLHGASLLEACDAEPIKQMEMSPMQTYGVAAQLCKICASEYEKGHELAFAALAYKCMEVAYLKVVYCKSSSASRFCQDLQSSLQMIPQGESPSSSASDVDNLNNLAMADKAALSKVSGPHAANHVIVPHNRPNFVRLLDFTKDVNSAMEAAKKSQDVFAAAHVKLKKSQNRDAIASIKRVVDFSFQDVQELVRLVRLTFNSNHQGLRGD
ncbi:cysteine-tryptophan domain-containing zinc finger protein 3-like isoform X1 [Salvia splendens]|uniref:cysteine-tryptophan domain-containing zinc finger protein 3-like isoform X1 n=1 Tax=Salvia splendens TaxID=180675 RepID=UPI001C25C6D1|nr:cysteine-tryptophan domain-containing zinc finger protein 3-like isoform X1 [Salvia splendens]